MLACRPAARSVHFALHHLPVETELSTGEARMAARSVDDSPVLSVGVAVPKRHARRAVTRSLLKRQARIAFGRHAAALHAGSWVLRLRAPFAVGTFSSAASAALRDAAQRELDALFAGLRGR